MKISKSIVATAVVAMLPLGAFAGDKDKTAPMGASASKHFEMLDTNKDGRISESEASTDSKIVFSTADRNRDGYLDNMEYSQRDMTRDSMPSSTDPVTDASKPRQ
jgi:hypothetical protein